ncbi:MAG: class I SAM-dependent methyltransferase [Nitrospiraceae bacterium]|nr:MAG: class I SAM-dependent methyltransferase [Nitrospiraceae bacterium]
MTLNGLKYRLYLLKQILFGKNLPVPKDEPNIINGYFNTTPEWLQFNAHANIFRLLDDIHVAEDYRAEAEELKSLTRCDKDQNRNISEIDVNHLLYNLVRHIKPKKILEIGVYAGTASCHMSAAQHKYMKTADMSLVDINRENLEQTRNNLTKFNLMKEVKFFEGDSEELAASGKIEVCDFIFLDADHTLKGVMRDVTSYWGLLAENGILAFHDSITWNGVRTVVNRIAKSENPTFTFASSLGCGVSIVLKKSNSPFQD